MWLGNPVVVEHRTGDLEDKGLVNTHCIAVYIPGQSDHTCASVARQYNSKGGDALRLGRLLKA